MSAKLEVLAVPTIEFGRSAMSTRSTIRRVVFRCVVAGTSSPVFNLDMRDDDFPSSTREVKGEERPEIFFPIPEKLRAAFEDPDLLAGLAEHLEKLASAPPSLDEVTARAARVRELQAEEEALLRRDAERKAAAAEKSSP